MDAAIRSSTLRLGAIVLGSFVFGALVQSALTSFGISLFNFEAQAFPRSAFCLGYFFLIAAMFLPCFQKERIGLLLFIPMLAQYYHVALGWDFPPGALSPFRLIPFIGCAISAACYTPWKQISITNGEKTAWAAIAAVACLGWTANMDRSEVGIVGIFFLVVFLPLLLLTVRHHCSLNGPTASAPLVAAGFAGFVTYCLGTLVVIKVASGLNLGGVTGLLGTRNVSDFNLIIAYLVLLWPLALRVANAFGPVMFAVNSMLLMASCLIGLSRVGIVAGPAIILCSLPALYWNRPKGLALAVAAFAVLCAGVWNYVPDRNSLQQVWVARFNVTNLGNVGKILDRVQPGGEDSFERDQLRVEAMRLASIEPMTGQGFGGFHKSSSLGFNDAHSLTFTVLAEHGVIGLAALYTALVIIFLRLARRCTLNERRPIIAVPMLLCFGAWLGVVHSVGGNLLMLAEAGFSVNAVNAILLGLYAINEAFPGEEPGSTA